MIKSTPLKIRSFRVFNLTGSRGDSYIFELPIFGGFLTEIGNISIWHNGILETDLIEGDELAKQFILTKKYRKPLDTSIDERHIRFNKLSVRYTCITDTFSYYCVSNKDNSGIYTAKVLKPTADEIITIPANCKNFLAMGSFLYGDKILQAPCEVLESKDAVLKVVSENGLVLLQ